MILSDKQKEFIINATHRYNIKIGARRCGKTYLDILYMIPNRIIERKGKDGLTVIFGVSNGTIERNVLQPLREIYGKNLVGFINSQNIANLFGEEVYCLGTEKKNQVSKIQGTSIKYAYGDEIAKWHKEVFIMIQASLDKSYSCLDGALNPENKNHWFKKDFIDQVELKGLDVYLQYYTIFDNPFLQQEFVDNLCKEYAGTVYYNRLILGQWCDAEGLIFRQIADNKDRYITEQKENGILTLGIDWGGNKSYHSITATKINRNFAKLQALRSERLKAKDTGTKELFKWIIDFVKDIIAEYGMIDAIYVDSAEQVLKNALIAELLKNGIHIPVYNSIKTEIKDRIEAINRLLNLDRLSFIKDKTSSIVEALQTALFDEKAKEDRWIDDGETSDIDSLDSFAYSWTNWQNQLMRYRGGI